MRPKLKGKKMEIETLRKEENSTPKPLNALAAEIHELNKASGWYEPERVRRPAEFHMLFVTEIAEATEEVRKGTPPMYWNDVRGGVNPIGPDELSQSIESCKKGIALFKPEGEAIEIADALIRMLDYCAHKGFDIDAAVRMKFEYNKTRSYRHGGKAF